MRITSGTCNKRANEDAHEECNWQKVQRKRGKLCDQYAAGKSVRIAPLPTAISKELLVSFMGEFGAIRKTHLSRNSLTIEYYKTEPVDILFSKTTWLQKETLSLERIGTKLDESHENMAPHQQTKTSLDDERSRFMERGDALSYAGTRYAIEKTSEFNDEMMTLLKAIQLTESELPTRYDVICNNVENMFKYIFPQCKLHRFGSTMAGLGLKQSDLDMYLYIGDTGLPSECYNSNISFEEFAQAILNKLKEELLTYRWPNIFSKIETISKTRAPIIKFIYAPTNVSCDITFKNSYGIYKTRFLKFCASYDARVKPLMLLIKYWAREYKVTGHGKTGKIPNYGPMCVIIFYLQTIGVLPTLVELRKNCTPTIINGWQVNFDEKYKNLALPTNNQSIVDLLYGFFHFVYKNFASPIDENSCGVLSLLDGKRYIKRNFDEVDNLPNYMYYYKVHVLRNNGDKIRTRNGIAVQDPIELSQNAIISAKESTLEHFRSVCGYTIKRIENTKHKPCKNVLKAILEGSLPRRKLVLKHKIDLKPLLNIELSADFDNRADICNKQYKKDNTYYIIFNLIKDMLEMIFKFNVIVSLKSNVLGKLDELPQTLIENHEEVQFLCKGNKRVWCNRLKHNQVFLDTRLSRLEQEAMISNKILKELNEKGLDEEDDVALICLCTVSKAQHSDAVIIRFNEYYDRTNELDKFYIFGYTWISKIIKETMAHMMRYEKPYNQLYLRKRRSTK
ncbi:poly(A) RNA polymerase, mitochondrial [Ooceraea biroi]|nr:poly(A) RNA polymerase, mitochondrial [Ooceraea biroi]